MKHSNKSKIEKGEEVKNRRAAKAWRQWADDLRRRLEQHERERKRRNWLLFLLLLLFDTTPARSIFSAPDPVTSLAPPRPQDWRDNFKRNIRTFDYAEHIRRDYAPRPGEDDLEVFDGLTAGDIAQIKREMQPPKLKVPFLPERYQYEVPHIWTLIDHLQLPFARHDAAIVIKMMTPPAISDWIDASVAEDGGKAIRYCRSKTPTETIAAMARAAVQWREDLRRQAEEALKPGTDPHGDYDPKL